MVNLLSRKVLFIIGIVALIGIAIFYLILKTRGPVCGNGICEYFETPTRCCKDCGCYPGSICNKKMNACEERVFGISDDRVKEIIENYYSSLGRNVTSIKIADIVNVGEDKIGRRSVVFFEPEDWKAVIITEDEQLIEEEKIG